MEIITDVAELNRVLQELLDHHGCTIVAPRHLAAEAHAYREASLSYDLETDAHVGEPFFHYVVTDGVAIFLFDGDPFLFYAFRCDPHELITYVDSDFDHTDVEACKEYVAGVLGKRADIAVAADLAYRWMAETQR